MGAGVMAWADVATANAKPGNIFLLCGGVTAKTPFAEVNNSSHDAEALLGLVYWPLPTVRAMTSRHPGLS
jgi:hypothetical protein